MPNYSFDSLAFRGLSQAGASKLPLFVAIVRQLCWSSVFVHCEDLHLEVSPVAQVRSLTTRQIRELVRPGGESAISELCIRKRRLRAAILTRARCHEFPRTRLVDGQLVFAAAGPTFLSRHCETHQPGLSVATPRMSAAPRKHPRAK